MRSVALALLLCSYSFGAIALVTHTSAAGDGSNVTTSTIDTTGANFIVVAVSQLDPPSGTLTDSKSNSWTSLASQSPFGDGNIRFYYSTNPTVGAGHTFTFTSSANRPSIAVASFSGVDVVSPLDAVVGHAVGSQDSVQPGNLTPAGDNEVLVTADVNTTASTFTIDQGFTLIESVVFNSGTTYGLQLAYIIQTTATSKDPTWQTVPSNGNNQAATLAAFKPFGATPSGLIRHKSSIMF